MEYLVGQNLGEFYAEIFNALYPQIANKKSGVLFMTISLLLDEEDQSHAEWICNRFKIKDDVSLDDELSVSADIVGLFVKKTTNKNLIENLVELAENIEEQFKNILGFTRNLHEVNNMKLFQLVIVGCFIVGVVACVRFLEKSKKQKVEESGKNQTFEDLPPKRKALESADLCLIIPAAVASSLVEGNLMNIPQVRELIDNSLYFLCTDPNDADAIYKRLEVTEEIAEVVGENREVYVQIRISDGGEVLGKKVPYILKRNLPSTGRATVEKLACLKYLSVAGLENFNRI